MKSAMPAPNHTNIEQLYVNRGGAAYDESPGAKGGVSGILRRLAAACTPEEWANYRNLLIGEGEEATDDLPDNGVDSPRNPPMDAAIKAATDRNGGFSFSDFAERIGRAPK